MAGEREPGTERPYPKRIIFEQQDGSITYLDGESAEKWSRVMDDLVTMGYVHGQMGQKDLGSLEWKKAENLQGITTPPTETGNPFDDEVEKRIVIFRKLWQEGDGKKPELENYLNMIRSGANVMRNSSPDSAVLDWLDEQISKVDLGRNHT